MGALPLTLLGVVLIFFFLFFCGFALRYLGKPYPGALLAIHFIFALAILLFLLVMTYIINRITPLGGEVTFTVVITIGLFVITGITGGTVALDDPRSMRVSKPHTWLPFITAISSGVLLYFLLQ